MRIARLSSWSRGRIGRLGSWVPLILIGMAVATASADESEGPEIRVPSGEVAAPADAESKRPSWNPAAVVGPDVSWENQRRIPIFSPFVSGTGYWGPSLHPDSD